MKKYISFFLYLYGMIFFLPFLLTLLLSGADVLSKNLPREERFYPLVLSTEISADVSQEVIKAQAVLVRTNCEAAREQDMLPKEYYGSLLEHYGVYPGEKDQPWDILKHYLIYKEGMDSTSEVLTYEQKPCWAPYHLVSSGTTRDGKEVLRDDAYRYLVSVDSTQDRQSPSYTQSCYFPQDFQQNISIISRDGAGYVMEVQVGEERMSGEELRRQMELPSSAFSLQTVEGSLRMFCKGKGHGLGLSQYGAQVMAKEGKSYIEILNYYFPQMEIKILK